MVGLHGFRHLTHPTFLPPQRLSGALTKKASFAGDANKAFKG